MVVPKACNEDQQAISILLLLLKSPPTSTPHSQYYYSERSFTFMLTSTVMKEKSDSQVKLFKVVI